MNPVTIEELLFDHIPDPVPPGNPFFLELQKVTKKRLKSKDSLKPIIHEGKRYCAWCCINELPDRRMKYCSDGCLNSSDANMYPQIYSYQFLLKKQQCKCNHCGYDFRPYYAQTLNSYLGKHRQSYERGPYVALWYTFTKRAQMFAAADFRGMQIDHIVPIFKGGYAIGLDNLQILCITCHIAKTAAENRGSKNRKEQM